MSSAVVTSKAEECIDRVISSQLLRILKPLLAPQEQTKIRDVSRQVRVALLGDKSAVESIRVLMPAHGESQDKWLTTAEAAELIGFSRPYMTAILDSKDFAGKVQKSSGGHRRVRASDVKDWMMINDINFPLSESDLVVLREPVPSEFFEEEELSEEEEKKRIEEINLANIESLKYRPK